MNDAAGVNDAAGRTVDIRALLGGREPDAFRRRVFVLCWLIAVLDGFDVQAMAFVAPVLTQAWGIPRALMGQVLTASLVGLALGSVFFGRLSDRIGRRPVVLGCVALFSVGSLVTAFSTSPMHLMLARCFTGIGLGGAIVASLALVSEYAPQRWRATLITAMFVGFPIGGSIGGLLSVPLISTTGWRGVFVLGGLAPLLLLPVCIRMLPESLQFAQARSVARSRVAELFVRARLPGTLLLWLICFANLLVLYLLINWLPSILHQAGFSLSLANVGAVAFNLGGVIGSLALSVAVDRLGAFRVLTLVYAATAAIVLMLARTQNVALALVLTSFAGAGIIGAQFCMNAVAAAFYPTAVRSTGVGWALGVGRVGSILGPLLGGAVLASGATLATVFSGVALPIGVCSAAVALLSLAYRTE